MGSVIGSKAIGDGSLVGNDIRAHRLMIETSEGKGFSMKWNRMVQSRKVTYVT